MNILNMFYRIRRRHNHFNYFLSYGLGYYYLLSHYRNRIWLNYIDSFYRNILNSFNLIRLLSNHFDPFYSVRLGLNPFCM